MSRAIDDCWNRIGVRGDRSCPRLQQQVHCRNCSVFNEAALTVMQRALPAGYQEEWSAHYAQAPQAAPQLDRSALVFRIGVEWLALPTQVVRFVGENTAIRRLPHRSGPVLLGLVNLRGQIYPCMSLAQLLQIQAHGKAAAGQDARARPCMLAVTLAGHALALPVVDVLGVQQYAHDALLVPSTALNEAAPRFIEGVLSLGERRIGCLDADVLGRQLTRQL